jgi:outer membrane protein OmpA-like peptidoglycan-associated protein
MLADKCPHKIHPKGTSMITNKLSSTTAIVVVLSFLQPLPGLAQAKSKTAVAIPSEALDSTVEAFERTLVCVKDFKGSPLDAEEACLDELKPAGFTCDSALLEHVETAKGSSPEIIAERVIRAANTEACTTEETEAAAEVKGTQEAEIAADVKAQEDAGARAEADAKATAEMKSAEAAQAEAKAQAELDAKAQVKADAAAVKEAESAAKAEATADKAEADAKAAKAEAKADDKVAAEAQVDADAKALLEAEAKSQAETTAIADSEAAAQAKKAEEAAIAEEKARAEAAAVAADECVVELVDAAGETLCADDMSQAEIAAVTAAAEADVEVTTQTVTEEAIRSSTEEFAETKTGSDDGGLNNLEKAGLLALGAVVIGSILKNGEKVTATTGERVVIQDQYGNYSVLKDDNVLVRQAGDTVRTETFSDGSTRTFVTRPDGVQIVTIRDSMGQVLRRTRIDTDGNEVLLIDDTRRVEPVEVSKLPKPNMSDLAYRDATDEAALREALRAAERRDLGRTFSLSQVRNYSEVRNLALEINLNNITFQTNSAAIQPTEAEQLRKIGLLMVDFIAENPREVFLIEGYTDAVGDESYNLLLSDRRAETVALALSEYFGVPPENLVAQGYGERFPLVPTLEAERLNRRVAVRRITNLIQPR